MRRPPSTPSDPSPSRTASLTGAGSSPSPLSSCASSATPTSVGASPASTRACASVTLSEATDHRHGFARGASAAAGGAASAVPAALVAPSAAEITGELAPAHLRHVEPGAAEWEAARAQVGRDADAVLEELQVRAHPEPALVHAHVEVGAGGAAVEPGAERHVPHLDGRQRDVDG